jgi:3-oxoacyl-[acyl-carrier protein] reductase
VGADGITVNAIAPGRIATPMSKSVSDEENQVFIDRSVVKRLGEPADIAYGILFLASPRSGFITGETLNINGGTLMD